MAEISEADAERLGIKEGDRIEITTVTGSICVSAQASSQISPGQIYMFHGYRDADVHHITTSNNLDPYPGFPGFRSTACKIARKD
jgi:formylmethanofuran dehydrogenase subunit D